ncbi:hypothetical protein [Clavibacter tessellarius]|uniref:hypothetical protein n=1 Tax=Clavibacter tessellarius TaxID=31965 RepID=UPI0032517BAD
MVTMSEGFQVLDTAAGTGDEPELTDTVFAADTPGHVVRHAGKTILYADGTSDTTVFDTAALATTDGMPETETIAGVEAHHGVSIVLEDGTFLTTVGNADGRNGIEVRDASGAVVAQSDQCPGVHGEGTAAGEVVVFGCEDGALLYDDGAITKLTAPDQPYGRMGNAYVSETSPIVVGDYKSDRDAEGYLLEAVTLIDTEAATLRVVDMPEGVGYTFRDVARGPGDMAYIMGSDGQVHVLDPATGELTGSFPVMDAWRARSSGRTRTPRSSSPTASGTSPSRPRRRCTRSTSRRARCSPARPSRSRRTRWRSPRADPRRGRGARGGGSAPRARRASGWRASGVRRPASGVGRRASGVRRADARVACGRVCGRGRRGCAASCHDPRSRTSRVASPRQASAPIPSGPIGSTRPEERPRMTTTVTRAPRPARILFSFARGRGHLNPMLPSRARPRRPATRPPSAAPGRSCSTRPASTTSTRGRCRRCRRRRARTGANATRAG